MRALSARTGPWRGLWMIWSCTWPWLLGQNRGYGIPRERREREKLNLSLQVKPWQTVTFDRKVRIGVMVDDGAVRPVAPIRRAMGRVIETLRRSEAFEVVDYQPILAREAWSVIVRESRFNPLTSEQALLAGRGRDGAGAYPEHGRAGAAVNTVDHRQRQRGPSIARRAAPGGRLAQRGLTLSMRSVETPFDLRWPVIGRMRASTFFSVRSVRLPHHVSERPSIGMWVEGVDRVDSQYTSFWNLANYPAAVFPTGLRVDPELDTQPYEPRNEDERWIAETFDPGFSQGVSVSRRRH